MGTTARTLLLSILFSVPALGTEESVDGMRYDSSDAMSSCSDSLSTGPTIFESRPHEACAALGSASTYVPAAGPEFLAAGVACHVIIAGGGQLAQDIRNGTISRCNQARQNTQNAACRCRQLRADILRIRQLQTAGMPREAIEQDMQTLSTQVSGALVAHQRSRAATRNACENGQQRQQFESASTQLDSCVAELRRAGDAMARHQ